MALHTESSGPQPSGRRWSISGFADMPVQVAGRSTVAVVGGGFSGLLACRHLRRDFNVVLIDAKEYFEYYPGILRAYIHPDEHGKLTALYQHICDKMRCRFVWGEVVRIDAVGKQVLVKPIFKDHANAVKFDYCIVCSGSQYGLYMTRAENSSSCAECLWYPTFLDKVIKKSSWGDLDERFISGRRAHFESELQELKAIAKKKGTIVVVGAGFVGIEWATEVKHFFPDINVVIGESRDACINVMPPKCREYCQRYLDKAGIKTIYNFDYKTFLSPCATKMCCSCSQLEERGLTGIERVYMAVGIRSINQFLPVECLDKMQYDEGTGDVTRGGWAVCNKRQQVLENGEKPFGGGTIFAAGNCCTVKGLQMPKNSFPGEEMASVAAHNITVMERMRNPSVHRGCLGFLRPPRLREIKWTWGMGLCATSLGPYDATFVALGTEQPGSGYTVLTGLLSAYQKEFIRWSKVDQCNMGCLGLTIWGLVH